MTRRALKTTTASLLAISLIQPFPAMAQFRTPTPQVTQHSSADAGEARLYLAQAEAEETSCFTDGKVDTARCDIDMLRAALETLLANGLPDAADRPAEDELTSALSADERIGLLSAAIETAEREASVEGTPTVAADADVTETDPAVQAEAAAEAEAAARAAAEAAGGAQAAAEETAQAEADAAATAEAEAANATAADQEAAATAAADEAAAAATAAAEDAEAEAARVAQAEAEAEAAVDAEAAATAKMEAQTENAVDDAAQAVSDAAGEATAETGRAGQEAEATAGSDAQSTPQVETETTAETSTPDATSDTETLTESETTAEAVPAAAPEPVATAQEEAEASAMKDAEIVAEQEEAQGLAAVAAATETTGNTTASGADTQASADVTTEVVTEADTRSSNEEFAATASGTAVQSDRGGLSNLEKAGLLALGAVAVGALIQNGQRVAATSGDRVIVEDNSGRFQVLKDDDALLRQPGATVETRRFDDGSTITLTTRDDGSRVRTIRDASGRVLRRSVIDSDGRETLLINDIDRIEPVNVSTLPPAPTRRLSFSEARSTDELRAALREAELRDLGRTFSLRQVREIVEVRELAPQISIEDVTFRTGSAAIERSEAEQLRDIGLFMREMIRENPREVFLIEGYTDAVGSAASNLLLSDRRAESVALALSEYFDVPPENMVVQGYGERFLKIPTLESERQNRRVAVRRITSLIAPR
jgi:outer membrane protein OmpA-like peptidoglycan-associated protein